jgi:hypothetical protein
METAAINSGTFSPDTFDFLPTSISVARAKSIYVKVRGFNNKIWACKNNAIHKQQNEWALTQK